MEVSVDDLLAILIVSHSNAVRSLPLDLSDVDHIDIFHKARVAELWTKVKNQRRRALDHEQFANLGLKLFKLRANKLSFIIEILEVELHLFEILLLGFFIDLQVRRHAADEDK